MTLSTSEFAEAPTELAKAERLRSARKFDHAEKICRSLIRQHPNYVGALHTLGLILADGGDFAGALPYLVRASMLNPKDWRILTALSGVYLKLGSKVMAARMLEYAAKYKPQDATILATLADIYFQDDEHEFAAEAYRNALNVDPSLTVAEIGLGRSCMYLGRFADAASAYERALRAGIESVGLLYGLAELPAGFTQVDILSLVDRIERKPKQNKEEFESVKAFVKAAGFDRSRQYGEAWNALQIANRLPFQQNREEYSRHRERRVAFLDQIRETPRVEAVCLHHRDDQPISLFILGPSRSGKTTLELLSTRLGGVKRGYEGPIVENAVRRAFQTAGLLTRERIGELPLGLEEMCRSFFEEELQERAAGARIFTNTLPGHLQEALRIANVLPNPRFVFMKRDVDDVTLRIFMSRYAAGNRHAYSVGSIREYIGWYYAMTDAIVERLPPELAITINYEDMIADPSAALQSLAELCNVTVPFGPLPELGDDRGCAKPYRSYLADDRQSL